MDIKALDYFIALEDCGHYSVAAKRVFISSQGLSSAIKRLEAELGVPLFDTVDGVVMPNEYGRIFSRYARETSHATKEAFATIGELKRRQSREITLISSVGLIDFYPDDFINQFNVENSLGARVNKMRALPDIECEESLRNGWYDFALINEPIDREQFASIPLYRDCMFAWVPVDNALSTKENLTSKDLSGQQLVELDLDYVQSHNTEQVLRENANGYDILHVDEMIQILGHTIRNGRIGLTVRPHAETVLDPRVRALPITDITWGFALCWSTGRILTDGDLALIDWFRKSPVSNAAQ